MSLEGKSIHEFESLAAAAKAVKGVASSLGTAESRGKPYCGFMWKRIKKKKKHSIFQEKYGRNLPISKVRNFLPWPHQKYHQRKNQDD